MAERNREDSDATATVEQTLPIRFRHFLLSDRMRRPNGEYSALGTVFALGAGLVLGLISLAALIAAVMGVFAGAAAALLVVASALAGTAATADIVVVLAVTVAFLGVAAHTIWSLRIDRRSLKATETTRDAGTFLLTVLFLAALIGVQLFLGAGVLVALPLWLSGAVTDPGGGIGLVPYLVGIGVLVVGSVARAGRRARTAPAVRS